MNDDCLFDYLQACIIKHLRETKQSSHEIRDALDGLGHRVGYGLIERMAPDTLRFTDDISVMKYICKEYWTSLFAKQIDNLRTNNSGTFVLQDNSFKMLANLTSDNEQQKEIIHYIFDFVCGMLRGSLNNFGYASNVSVEALTMPCCKFQRHALS